MIENSPGVAASVDAERGLLGAVLINGDALAAVAWIVRREDFYIVRHQWIWEAMLALHERGEVVDFLTVVEELGRRNHLDEVGGSAYVTSLLTATPSSLHAEAYARIVQRAGARRALLAAAVEIANCAVRDDEDMYERAERALFAVTRRGPRRR